MRAFHLVFGDGNDFLVFLLVQFVAFFGRLEESSDTLKQRDGAHPSAKCAPEEKHQHCHDGKGNKGARQQRLGGYHGGDGAKGAEHGDSIPAESRKGSHADSRNKAYAQDDEDDGGRYGANVVRFHDDLLLQGFERSDDDGSFGRA